MIENGSEKRITYIILTGSVGNKLLLSLAVWEYENI
jgi:hypothetical protein